jgi:hypothetical protein
MIRVFFSYSNADDDDCNELEKHLKTLEHQNLIESWHNRRITTGDERPNRIDEELRRADIILFLISVDFISSKHCYEREMEEALIRHENGEAAVIPIILRPCNWKDLPFGKLQAATKDGKPVSHYPSKDDAFLEITQSIKAVAKELYKRRHTPSKLSSIAPYSTNRIGISKLSQENSGLLPLRRSDIFLNKLKRYSWSLVVIVVLAIVIIARTTVRPELTQSPLETAPTYAQSELQRAVSQAFLDEINKSKSTANKVNDSLTNETSKLASKNAPQKITTDPRNWEQRECDWDFSGQTSFVSQGKPKDCELIYNFSIQTPYKISVDATLKDGAYKAAIIFNVVGSSFYQFEIEANFIDKTGIVRLWDSNNWQGGHSLYVKNVDLPSSKTISLSVEVHDQETVFYINNHKVFTYQCQIIFDSKIGLRSAWTRTEFRNFSIAKIQR